MQVAASSSAVRVPCASTRLAGSRSSLGRIAGLTPVFTTRQSRAAVTVRAEKQQVSFEPALVLIEPHSHQHLAQKLVLLEQMMPCHLLHAMLPTAGVNAYDLRIGSAPMEASST